MTWECKHQISPSSAYVYQGRPLLAFGVVGKAFTAEEFKYFEENIIGEGSAVCHLLAKFAYTTQS